MRTYYFYSGGYTYHPECAAHLRIMGRIVPLHSAARCRHCGEYLAFAPVWTLTAWGE
jgi:hypothetical protein